MEPEDRVFDFNSLAAAVVVNAGSTYLATTISTGTLAVKWSTH